MTIDRAVIEERKVRSSTNFNILLKLSDTVDTLSRESMHCAGNKIIKKAMMGKIKFSSESIPDSRYGFSFRNRFRIWLRIGSGIGMGSGISSGIMIGSGIRFGSKISIGFGIGVSFDISIRMCVWIQ